MGLAGLLSLVGAYISNRLKSKFNQYSRVPISSGKSGKEIAETMLRFYGIQDVKVVQGKVFIRPLQPIE